MSRMANSPVQLPNGVEAALRAGEVSVKGGKGDLRLALPAEVEVAEGEDGLRVSPRSDSRRANAMVGTVHSLLRNMVTGVSEGFEKKLELRGVGYRARAQGAKLNLTVGYSHPIDYAVPDGISVQTPSQTEIVVSGADKQKVGQVAAEIRMFRPPEPYKGKGIRYVGERVFSKEAKKK
ncbi:MAG: 50S ribosomal protein L6 [Gammaproteobacteria bacterium]|nr:50S ribosomal protein L6 [Gammaproteobacteria bacterium]